jgi:hypothetical protein
MGEFIGQKEQWLQGYLAALRDIQVMIAESTKNCNFSVKVYTDGLITKIAEIADKQRNK